MSIIVILFSLLLAPASSATAQTPEPQPSSAPTPTAESEPRPLSLGFHVAQGDSLHMAAVRAAGGSFAVVVFNWANIEPEPNYLYWEVPDAALRAAEFYGIELIARLDQPPAWALDASDPTPWDLEAYTNFARRVAERYGNRLAGVILWNEPNLSLEWNGQPPDAAGYVEMLKAAYPAVKAVAPDLPVLMGGLASTEGEGDWAINDLDYLQALYAAGAGDYFDVLTAHPYGFGRPPDDPPEKYRPNFRRLELYREIMAAYGDGDKPIWVTEMGWLTSTDDPRHEWQVVTPTVQADYILQAITYAQDSYPWLERLGLWVLNSAGDAYGYAIWQGPDQTTPAYDTLVDTCPSRSQTCDVSPSSYNSQPSAIHDAQIPILAPDAIIRLGDRGTLHPHWVHLHRGGRNFSPDWQGEFYLTADQANQPYDLLLETMQVTQSTNQLFINEVELAYLHARPRPDITSTWVTQRFSVLPTLLRPGANTLSLRVGPRNPARQYITARWENMQFRNIRLVPPDTLLPPILNDWQPLPSPSGWSETNRLRPGLSNDLWLTGNRPGELWRGIQTAESPAAPPSHRASNEHKTDKVPPSGGPGGPLPLQSRLILENRAGNRPDLIFNDLLPTPQMQLAATHRGLFWRTNGRFDWQPVTDAPTGHAYVVVRANDRFYAGFEAEGLWSAASPTGPWQRTPLTATSVVDLATASYTPTERLAPAEWLYAVTDQTEIFANNGPDPDWQRLLLPGLSTEALNEAGESPGDKLRPRLYPMANGKLLVRHQDRLWLQSEHDPTGWELFGPDHLAGKLLSALNCCEPGRTLVGSNDAGLWHLTQTGEWQRLDDGTFTTTDVTGLLQVENTLYAAGDLGLFQSWDGRTWPKVMGLPPTVSDLLVDPVDPSRWIAGTPAGVYRSQDRGQSWETVSPPWTIWDMAFGPQERLFLGRSNGLAWADDLGTIPIQWQTAGGMKRVYFLSVNPHPVEAQLVWTGTWGNNVGASNDGGQTIAPLHNGLETLSGLDLIWHPTPGQVTLATIEGLYRTDDHGQSWFRLPGPLTRQTIHALWQGDGGAIWAGAADGLWVSRDYGVSWELANGMPQATVLRLGQITVPLPPPLPPPPPFVEQGHQPLVYAQHRWLWAGTEAAGLWLSQDNGAAWHFAGLPNRSIYNIFFDPLQPGRLIAATDQGIFAVTVSEETMLAIAQP